jgi:hypothetical protein
MEYHYEKKVEMVRNLSPEQSTKERHSHQGLELYHLQCQRSTASQGQRRYEAVEDGRTGEKLR